MLFANLLLSISIIICFLLGLFILISNSKKALNRAFSAFLFSATIWLITNLLTNLFEDPKISLVFARSTLIGALFMPYTFVLFARIYSNEKNFTKRSATLLAIPPLILGLFTFTSFNIVKVDAYGLHTVTGSLYYILTPLILGYFAWGLWTLVRFYKLTPNINERARLRYIFLGVVLTLVPTAVTNAILPALGIYNSYLYGPNAIILLAACTSIAIIKHRLLDVRLIVARSLAYLLIITTIAVLYGIVVFYLAGKLFGINRFSQQIVPLLAAILIALTFSSLNKFFNRVSNKFFYRDAYDSQVFLDQFNKLLVSTYELEPLLRRAAKIIETNLKPVYVVFGLKETETTPQRITGTTNHPKFTEAQIKYVRGITPSMHRRLIITDLLEDKYTEVQSVLQSAEISVMARLASRLSEEGMGYLILGPKKSGNLYSPQDLKIIEIISNELVIAIQNAQRTEEIQNFNITLQAKVDDATRKLRRTNEKLKQMDETKDDFISMASHQLRTPLTSVKGYISMVLEEDAGKITDTQRDMLGQAFFSSQRMVYLIADLLNVSRLKTGKFIIERAPVQLDQIVQQELRQLQETAAARQLTLQFDQPDKFPSMMLDETKTRQIIMNFIDNAIYYTPAGGHIIVRLVNNQNTIELRVEDNGIGVPKHEQQHLFTKFYRAGNARQARPDGTGLGLYMAKKVIVAQGGTLIFTSEESKGSTFGFIFSKSYASSDTNKPTNISMPVAQPAAVTK